jgi:hypothetical protein
MLQSALITDRNQDAKNAGDHRYVCMTGKGLVAETARGCRYALMEI